jgi:hypothetical protein
MEEEQDDVRSIDWDVLVWHGIAALVVLALAQPALHWTWGFLQYVVPR